MKKIILILTIVFSAFIAKSQDILIMQNGQELETKIIEVNPSQVKYYLYDDIEGPIYIVNRADAFKIKYASGSESLLNEHKMVEETEVRLPSKRRIGLAVRPEISGVLITADRINSATKSMDFSLNVVYQIKKKLSLGVGAAYDITKDAGNFVPVYFNLRGYFNNRLSSPYYDIRIGYSIPTSEKKKDLSTNEISSYLTSQIKRAYVRFGVGMDIYNFSIGVNVGLCENHVDVYTLSKEEGSDGTYKKEPTQEINKVFIGLTLGYSIQCSKKK